MDGDRRTNGLKEGRTERQHEPVGRQEVAIRIAKPRALELIPSKSYCLQPRHHLIAIAGYATSEIANVFGLANAVNTWITEVGRGRGGGQLLN